MAERYSELLADVDELILPKTMPNRIHSWHLYSVRFDPMSYEINRADLIEELKRAGIGTKLWDPDINYASIAKGYGLYAEGPITDPKDLAAAIRRGIERVKAGEPVLLDVVTQPR